MIARFTIISVFSGQLMAIFGHTSEVKGHVYRVINGQRYKFPVFTGKIMHVHTCAHSAVCVPGPFSSPQRAWIQDWYVCACAHAYVHVRVRARVRICNQSTLRRPV